MASHYYTKKKKMYICLILAWLKKKKKTQQKKGLCINTYICKCQPQNRKKNLQQCCGPGGDGNELVLCSRWSEGR